MEQIRRIMRPTDVPDTGNILEILHYIKCDNCFSHGFLNKALLKSNSLARS